MNGPRAEDFLTDAAENDIKLLILMQDVANNLREELGDSWERWVGAAVVASWIIPAFADHFGENLLHQRRRAPSPDTVRSFAFLVGILDAVIRDGPEES